ncbi:Rrf2 family transcriptional regulator [Desulfosporosinus sp. Tol-M]|nr:Rrf2 family transcriptional regulator [Desulfosporosinus sp. Tol-M]
MKFSTKGRYALRVMVELAQHGKDEYIPLKLISERQEISMKYLEMIIAILHRAGFVLSHRGKDGGYKLAKAANEYTVGSVLKLAEGSLAPVACLDNKIITCKRANHCITLPMWQKLDKLIDDYLESVTIEDLLLQQNQFLGNDYYI